MTGLLLDSISPEIDAVNDLLHYFMDFMHADSWTSYFLCNYLHFEKGSTIINSTITQTVHNSSNKV